MWGKRIIWKNKLFHTEILKLIVVGFRNYFLGLQKVFGNDKTFEIFTKHDSVKEHQNPGISKMMTK